MKGSVRERYLDMVKMAGAVMIVALHTLSSTINAGGGYLSDIQCTIVHVLHQLFYIAVPLFVLATGAGFLSGGRDNSYGNMWVHIRKTLFCITVFGLLFALINVLADGGRILPGDLILSVLTDHTWSHMWYLYRLLGVYLCMPMLSAFMGRTGWKEQLIFAGLVLFFACLYPYVAGLIGFIPATVMPLSGIWLFYLIVGGMMGRMPEKLRRYRYLPVTGFLAGISAILWESVQGGSFDEAHPFVLLTTCCLFAEIRICCEGKSSSSWLAGLARTAMGVYVIHPIFIHVCVRVIGFNPQYHLPLLTLPLTVAVIFVCSAVVVWLLRKIPPVRKYIL